MPSRARTAFEAGPAPGRFTFQMRKTEDTIPKPEGSHRFQGGTRTLSSSSSVEESGLLESQALRLALVSDQAVDLPRSLSGSRQPGTRTLQSRFWRPARALRVAHEVEPEGIGPSFPDCQPGVLPLDDGPLGPENANLAPPALRSPYSSESWRQSLCRARKSNLASPQLWNRRDSNTHPLAANEVSSLWTTAPWSRRESNAHSRAANAKSYRWTTTPKWSEWGILPSRPPDPESGALLSELHSVSLG